MVQNHISSIFSIVDFSSSTQKASSINLREYKTCEILVVIVLNLDILLISQEARHAVEQPLESGTVKVILVNSLPTLQKHCDQFYKSGDTRDKKGWTARVGLANRLPQKEEW